MQEGKGPLPEGPGGDPLDYRKDAKTVAFAESTPSAARYTKSEQQYRIVSSTVILGTEATQQRHS